MMKLLRKPISLFLFSCIVSIGTLLLYNIPFFSYVAENTNAQAGGKVLLLTSLVDDLSRDVPDANGGAYPAGSIIDYQCDGCLFYLHLQRNH